jgi:hypothetical protein
VLDDVVGVILAVECGRSCLLRVVCLQMHIELHDDEITLPRGAPAQA